MPAGKDRRRDNGVISDSHFAKHLTGTRLSQSTSDKGLAATARARVEVRDTSIKGARLLQRSMKRVPIFTPPTHRVSLLFHLLPPPHCAHSMLGPTKREPDRKTPPLLLSVPLPSYRSVSTILSPPPRSRPTDAARFPVRTSHDQKQCTNCGETDTPQWRGTLCNACALWRRSRGTDRPLPLLFTRRRARSPSRDRSASIGEAADDAGRCCDMCGAPGEAGRAGCAGCEREKGGQRTRVGFSRGPDYPFV